MQPISQVSRRLPWLDGLRAVAIFMVIARHVLDHPYAAFYHGRVQHGGFGTLVVLTAAGVGWAGVDLFFVISGYLVAGSAIVAARNERFYVTEFLAKRFVRVFVPALVFMIAYRFYFQYPALDTIWGVFSAPHAAANLLFFTNYDNGIWLPHFWSLDVEAHFYLAVAILAPFARFGRNTFRLGLALLLVSLAFSVFRIACGFVGLPSQNFYALSHWQIDFFAIGTALRLIFDARGWPRLGATVGLPLAVAAVAAAAIIAAYPEGTLEEGFFQPPLTDQPPLTIALGLILAASAALMIAAARGGYARFMSARPLRAIGTISFSVYIVHLPLIDAVTATLRRAVSPLAADPLLVYLAFLSVIVPLCLGVGLLFYFAIERPAFWLHSRIRIRLGASTLQVHKAD